jgi:hypothetical protein
MDSTCRNKRKCSNAYRKFVTTNNSFEADGHGPRYTTVLRQPSGRVLVTIKTMDDLRKALSEIGITIWAIQAKNEAFYSVDIQTKESVLELFMTDTVDDFPHKPIEQVKR